MGSLEKVSDRRVLELQRLYGDQANKGSAVSFTRDLESICAEVLRLRAAQKGHQNG